MRVRIIWSSGERGRERARKGKKEYREVGHTRREKERRTVEQQQIDVVQIRLQRLAQVALTEVDHVADAPAALGPVPSRPGGLCGLVLGGDDARAAARPRGVGRGRQGEVDGADAERGARLDDGLGPRGPAQLVDELGLVAVQRDELVAHDLVHGRPLEVVARQGPLLPQGLVVEPGEQVDDVRGDALERVGRGRGPLGPGRRHRERLWSVAVLCVWLV